MRSDIFYNVKDLNLRQRINLIKFAKVNSFNWWVDESDCSKSWARQKIDMSFEEVIKKLKISSHFVVVKRYGGYGENSEYGQICFCTMKDPDYFLWVDVETEVLSEIIKKFNLNKL